MSADLHERLGWPTAGSVIIIVQHEYVLLDDPASIRRLWHRGSPGERRLFRLIYDAGLWGRSPVYAAPIDPATGLPYGLPEGIVPVVLIPRWIAVHGAGTTVPPDMLRLARRRCVPWSDSATGRSIVEHNRALIERLNAVLAYVQERLLRQ